MPIVGVILVLLGLLWFLQGSDIVHIQPILCFASCEPITGKSLPWQVTGAVLCIIGLALFVKSVRMKSNFRPKDEAKDKPVVFVIPKLNFR